MISAIGYFTNGGNVWNISILFLIPIVATKIVVHTYALLCYFLIFYWFLKRSKTEKFLNGQMVLTQVPPGQFARNRLEILAGVTSQPSNARILWQ